MQCLSRRTERRGVHVAEALGGTAEGSYKQEAAAVEEDEEMEREDGRSLKELCLVSVRRVRALRETT
jgi:hypothetical protein